MNTCILIDDAPNLFDVNANLYVDPTHSTIQLSIDGYDIPLLAKHEWEKHDEGMFISLQTWFYADIIQSFDAVKEAQSAGKL